MIRSARLERGFAIVVALVIFVLGTVLVSLLFALGSLETQEVHRSKAEQIAQRAAESGINSAIDRLGENIARSFFSDPVEAYYWHGGDIPNQFGADNGDGFIANDGEVPGAKIGEVFTRDFGLDNLPDILEPRFQTTNDVGVPFPPDLDPSGDNLRPVDILAGTQAQPPTLRVEGNDLFDAPPQDNQGRSQLFAVQAPVNNLTQVNGTVVDLAVGQDPRSSFSEVKNVFIPGLGNNITIPYDPITNPDPAGDDYNPIFNPTGLEGRVLNQANLYQGPTVENPDTRWRRYLRRDGGGGEFGDGTLQGFTAVRAIDTSTKIDINGPSLLTARLLDSLIQMTGTSIGPVTPFNAPLGNNGRGIEWTPMPNPTLLATGTNWTSLYLDAAQSFLMPNRAFNAFGSPLPNLAASVTDRDGDGDIDIQDYQQWLQGVLDGTIPGSSPADLSPLRKIASSQAEEENYFHQPPSLIDPDVIVIIKYRNRNLGGRFTSLTQLMEVRRADGTLIFDQRDRDELLRLMEFVTVEAWRDPNGIVHRNGETLLPTVAVNTPTNEAEFLNPTLAAGAALFRPVFAPNAEPWQEIFQNGTCDNKEKFNPDADRGLQQYVDWIEINKGNKFNCDAMPGNGFYENGAGNQHSITAADLLVPPELASSSPPNWEAPAAKPAWYMDVTVENLLSPGTLISYRLYPWYCHWRDDGDGIFESGEGDDEAAYRPGVPESDFDVPDDGSAFVSNNNKIEVGISHPLALVPLDGVNVGPGPSGEQFILRGIRVCGEFESNYRGHFQITLSHHNYHIWGHEPLPVGSEVGPDLGPPLDCPQNGDSDRDGRSFENEPPGVDLDGDGTLGEVETCAPLISYDSTGPLWDREGHWTKEIKFNIDTSTGQDFCKEWKWDNSILPSNPRYLNMDQFKDIFPYSSRWTHVPFYESQCGTNPLPCPSPEISHPKILYGKWRLVVLNYNPSRWASEEDPIWNPFLIRRFTGNGGVAARSWRVESGRNGVNGWSPYASSRFYAENALSHRHASYNYPVSNSYDDGAIDDAITYPLNLFPPTAPFDHCFASTAPGNPFDPPIFNFDAAQKNGLLDVDPYICLFEPKNNADRDAMFSEASTGSTYYSDPDTSTLYADSTLFLDSGRDHSSSLFEPKSSRIFRQFNVPTALPASGFDFFGDNYNSFVPSNAALPNMGFDCFGNPFYRMSNSFGWERNFRFDMIPGMYNSNLNVSFPGVFASDNITNRGFASVPGGASMPTGPFDPLPPNNPTNATTLLNIPNLLTTTAITVDPANPSLADKNRFATPGEFFYDHGRDGIPNTGDQGEGDGAWEPGEAFLDYGLDGVADANERAFTDSAMTTLVASNPCNADLHGDNYRVVNGRPEGTEKNGLFDLLAEPYFDLDGNGVHTHSPFSPTVATDPVGARALTYMDTNGNGIYDRGVYREQRAPVNVNAAPEEVLASVIYQGVIMPTKKRQDRFHEISLDFGAGPNSALDDFDWSSVIPDPAINPGADLNRPNILKSRNLAQGLARAIFLRRLGLYPAGAAGIGAGPFRSWQEFDLFVRTVLATTTETAKFGGAGINPWGTQVDGTPLGNPFVGVPAGFRQVMIERLLTQLIPNELSPMNSGSFIPKSRYTKEDFPYPTTEFCLGPTGVYEITATGLAVATGPSLTSLQQNQSPTQDAAIGNVLANPDLLASKSIEAEVEIQKTIKIFDHQKLSSREDFENSKAAGRGVSISSPSQSASKITMESSVTVEELVAASDQSRTNTSTQSPTQPFLITRPRVTVFDPTRGLLFVADSLAAAGEPADFTNNYTVGTSNWGRMIQVFEFSQDRNIDARSPLRNIPRNNGEAWSFNDGTQQYSFGIIKNGYGLNGIGIPGAMAFDPNFPTPSNFPANAAYLGRLYIQDIFTNGFLRAIDCGRDTSGGFVTREVVFDTALSAPAGFVRPAGIALAPDRREIFALWMQNGGGFPVTVQRLRYAEGSPYPGGGTSALNIIENSASLPMDGFNFPVGVNYDPATEKLFVAGTSSQANPFGRLFSFNVRNPIAGASWTFPFPALSPAGGAATFPPGYGILSTLSNAINRRVVGMELDSASGLLFLLWNCPAGTSDANGFGAYLAAFPIGAAPYLTAPLANPFPMELTTVSGNAAAVDDNNRPILAASFALDPVQKSILVVPVEQRRAATNPHVFHKNRPHAMSYEGDGLRILDLLNPVQLWTNNAAAIVPTYFLESFPGKGMFFLSTYTNNVNLREALQNLPPNELYAQAPPGAPPDPAGNVSRSIRLLQLKGFGFTGNNSAEALSQDAKLKAKENAVPLSAFMLDPSAGANTNWWVHSRATFDGDRYFVQPQYRLGSTVAAGTNISTTTLGVRPIVSTGGNVPPGVHEITVDSNAPQTAGMGNLQGYYFPQAAVESLRTVKRADNTPGLPHPQEDPENSWRHLNGGTEFWFRLNALPQMAGAVGSLNFGSQIVLWEHFSKAKVELQTMIPGTPPIFDFSNNPFLPGPGNPVQQKQELFNILESGRQYLNNYYFPEPVTGLTAGKIHSFQFGPDAIDLWVYDRILMTGFVDNNGDNVPDQASFVYERRLAGGVGDYPVLFQDWRDAIHISEPWGDYPGSQDFGFRPKSRSDVFYFARPHGEDQNGAKVVGNQDLSQKSQQWRYAQVKVNWDVDGNGNFTHDANSNGVIDANEDFSDSYRFVPIWSNSVPTDIASGAPNPRQAAVSCSIANVPLNIGEWMRIGYASSVNFNPAAGPATALMMPALGNGTVMKIWTNRSFQTSQASVPAQTIPNALSPAIPTWWDFPEGKGFLALSAYNFPAQTAQTGRTAGPVFPGFSCSFDDIVFYEKGYPIFQANQALIPRFEIGEGGWDPVTSNVIYPTGFNSYLAAEPFWDFNRNGIRDNTSPSYWDFNRNNRWDFGELRALNNEVSAPPLAPILSANFGEPFVDMDGDLNWNGAGDRLFDLNGNGTADGEIFQDINGNLVWDIGERFLNRNGNVDALGNPIYDGGEPYFDLDGVFGFRFGGEPFNEVNPPYNDGQWNPGDPFKDENGNGIWDNGEPYVSWSRASAGVGPLAGELYRENGGRNAHQVDGPGFTFVGVAGADWNQNGRYESNGVLEGTFSKPIPAGSRLASVSFTVWKPKRDTAIAVEPETQGRVAVDLELFAKDGRFLGLWKGVDNLTQDLGGNTVVVDESGIGLPVPADAYVKYRINFYMPSPLNNVPPGDVRRPSVTPVLDDLSLNVVLPPAAQTVFEDRVVGGILVRDFERGNVVQ